MELLEQATQGKSLLEHFRNQLDSILQKDHIELVHIVARIHGGHVFRRWLTRVDRNNYKKKIQGIPNDVTSIEIDCLHHPNSRSVELTSNALNSYRGKFGFTLSIKGRTHKFSALQMIAANLSFSAAISKIFTAEELPTPESCTITLLKSEQYYFTVSAQNCEFYSLYRGNRLTLIETINNNTVAKTIKLMASWLANQVNQNGQASYKYWPSKDLYSDANNAIRQWMATVCLGRAARAYGSKPLQDIANRNLAYNIASMYFEDNKLGYIFLDGSAKLGAAALAALAILESNDRHKYLTQEYGLRNLIDHLSNPDGSFKTFYIPSDRAGNENFYSGEALLFQAQEFAISKNPDLLRKIMQSFEYYREWHRLNRNPAFVPWHTQAYWLVWKVNRSPELAQFIFEMNDWLLSMQQWDSAEFLDMQGRFYDPARPHFGPPHASSTGVYLEGLIDAFSIAKEMGELDRAENYRLAIVRGVRSLMQLQFKDEVDCFYISNVNRVLGGVRTTEYDNTIRIDNVQHGLMALLKIITRFSETDYLIPAKTHNTQPIRHSTDQYKHFKKMDFSIDIESIRQEIDLNSHLWLENTSRQQNIQVQRETQTIFLRTAKKPFPPGVSGNDIHPSAETKNSAAFPFLMQTLQEFACSINGELSRATIVRLQPESRVYPHIDEGEYYKYRDRYHIVVHSPAGSEMIAGNEKVIWQEGEFWWFDNKAMHEAYNKGSDFRVHIIFDVLPKHNIARIADALIKQSIYCAPPAVVSSLKTVSTYNCYPSCEVNLPAPQMMASQLKKYQASSFFCGTYKLPSVTIEEYENVILVGNKFIVIAENGAVLEASLPTFHHKPDHQWQTRKPDFHAEVYKNDVLGIDEPCAVISNANWKNYWHWHAQCITSIQALKKANLFGKVKLITPTLNEWRLQSLCALGVEESMLIKVTTNLIRVKRLHRPSCINKTHQPYAHPSSLETYRAICNFFIRKPACSELSKLIYIARFDAKNARNLTNEEMLAERLRTMGFEIITPGDLSYEKQIEVFSQADVVVGAHGAGLTNIVFCKPDTLIVEIFPEYYLFDKKLAYRSHAHIGGMKYACYVADGYVDNSHRIEAKTLLSQGMQSNFPWKIDTDKFSDFLITIMRSHFSTFY